MSISTQRIAALAAASALGLGGAFVSTDALAQTADPTASPTASPTATPTVTATPTPSETTPAAKTETSFGGTSSSKTPTYEINGNTGVSTSKGWLEDAEGNRVPNATITLYNYTGEKRGAQLGQATTNANGEFTLTATVPANVRSQDYNLELVYGGNAELAGTSAVLHLRSAQPTGAPSGPATTAAPTTKPTTPGKKPGLPSTGAEGMPVLPALASLGVLAAGAAVVLRRK